MFVLSFEGIISLFMTEFKIKIYHQSGNFNTSALDTQQMSLGEIVEKKFFHCFFGRQVMSDVFCGVKRLKLLRAVARKSAILINK